ncbi:uncharacterized protein VTP21DRAFT_8814 [Calcarisporiella thermophila]|uniref:uncharacterized protein n=1 Tax=Calcarisporiella thermophila TaxID=911321 RepID=UPI0037425893
MADPATAERGDNGHGFAAKQIEHVEKSKSTSGLRDLFSLRLDEKPENPFRLIAKLNRQQHLTFLAAFLGWTLDAFDFFTVSLTISYIAKEFNNRPISEVTGAITTTLMLRPIGALIFGALADRFGRRGPLMLDIILYSAFELASGFAPNWETFIVLRGLFGVAMGGEWALGASLSMEVLPAECRGLYSGILQQGYAFGYLLATVIARAVNIEANGWRPLFYIGAAPALLTILIRFFVPESDTWRKTEQQRRMKKISYLTQVKTVFQKHWLRVIYGIVLMTLFNFMSHGSQDLYPSFLRSQVGLDENQLTVTMVLANLGAIVGGTLLGYYSQYFGRRRAIIICAFLGGCFIPLWVLPRENIGLLQFGAFMLQFFVQGAWGVVPVHLNELSPAEFRGTYTGLSYQIGNLISASAAQIEATLGEKFPTPQGKADYGLTQAILMAIIFFLMIVITAIGFEHRARDLEDHLDSNLRETEEKSIELKPDEQDTGTADAKQAAPSAKDQGENAGTEKSS